MNVKSLLQLTLKEDHMRESSAEESDLASEPTESFLKTLLLE